MFLTLSHQRIPLKSLSVSLKALPYISWSPMCFCLCQPLLFLAPLFHLSDCLSFPPLLFPRLSVTQIPLTPLPQHLSASLSLTNVPLSFPLRSFLLCLHRSPPTAAILEQKRWERFFDLGNCSLSFVFMPVYLLYSCQVL